MRGSSLATGIGCAVGFAVAVIAVPGLFSLIVCDTFFEQGCGNNEWIMMWGTALAAIVIGLVVAWGVAHWIDRGMADED